MIIDVTGFIACDRAADRVPLPSGLVRDTDRWPGRVHHFCQEPSEPLNSMPAIDGRRSDLSG
ncbi:hypothetical protein [Streptosporangium sandarakinum]|uniref:hypothetical protein n=1 Tax=Streptosporangium sandarakinum TaxID=1260955 RepID=UPI0034159F72